MRNVGFDTALPTSSIYGALLNNCWGASELPTPRAHGWSGKIDRIPNRKMPCISMSPPRHRFAEPMGTQGAFGV